MDLFDKKFVYFEWDEKLEGKKCFVSDHLKSLKYDVDTSGPRYPVFSGSEFKNSAGLDFAFAYYDPNYDVKKAYIEGKTVQYWVGDEWSSLSAADRENIQEMGLDWFNDNYKYRIKPEEKWKVVYEDMCFRIYPKQTYCYRGDVLFEGTADECSDWIKGRELAEKEVYGRTDRVELNDATASTKWEIRPFKDCDELVSEYKKLFNANCPSYTMPLIWLHCTEAGDDRLIMGYDRVRSLVHLNGSWRCLNTLFDKYTFLDGSPCGVEEK